MHNPIRVAIVGGTGLLGNVVVRTLQERPELVDLTVISRKSSTNSASTLATKVVTVGSYIENDGEELVAHLNGIDVLVSMLPGGVAPSGKFKSRVIK